MMVMRISTQNDLLKQDIERLQKENERLRLERGVMIMSEYYAGKGCTCCASAEFECCCDVDWTEPEVYELRKRIAELGDLAQSIIDSESADPSVRVLMYHAWVHRAKKLKVGDL